MIAKVVQDDLALAIQADRGVLLASPLRADVKRVMWGALELAPTLSERRRKTTGVAVEVTKRVLVVVDATEAESVEVTSRATVGFVVVLALELAPGAGPDATLLVAAVDSALAAEAEDVTESGRVPLKGVPAQMT